MKTLNSLQLESVRRVHQWEIRVPMFLSSLLWILCVRRVIEQSHFLDVFSLLFISTVAQCLLYSVAQKEASMHTNYLFTYVMHTVYALLNVAFLITQNPNINWVNIAAIAFGTLVFPTIWRGLSIRIQKQIAKKEYINQLIAEDQAKINY